MAQSKQPDTMEKIISLCKRRGFVYQGSEIYGGLAGTWDYGPYGVALKKNIEGLWWKRFVTDREDMYGMDAAILMNQNVWKASGHVGGFSDPLVECAKCKRRFRADQIIDKKKCTECGGTLGEEKQFNMMFKTQIGATEDETSISYLRPETAQGMFVNFKNVYDSFHPKLPFGLAQIGKAFRNEIAPRDFLFRVRELEQMEIEYFVRPSEWEEKFEEFRKEVWEFTKDVGLPKENIHELEVPDGERAHYSKRTIDFEFDFPFGKKELYGLAYRTDYDLGSHSKASTVPLEYFDEDTKERFTPHCIEPSFGVGRTMLAVLASAYTEDEMGGETRTFLKFAPAVAPVKIAVFPLLKNKPQLVEKAREVYALLKKEFGAVEFDDNGNIGKRYRRQDEIGTPFCVTVDFDTLEKDNTVTVRDRDSGIQTRVAIAELLERLTKLLG
ncbi:MAG: glycine--tRNA ligase [Candidatus Taylorbacteria bacterium RIFCSPHIGHO2_01_FULL_46_22b]|uniref:Glycine--tRNA ligase n=1 Tax=Candidatus Taylorbacteria bacterium RIFCSPHIGHO2_01_FULL_46_22b TaxID=1802301 RepID=A0A1G2M4Q9_9BACT|nr:MAG: glycine--tRNA ligase [Candidatus Taylorbacteria bacterium RIFCSPHIGHO2_01_FULL_46_22b]